MAKLSKLLIFEGDETKPRKAAFFNNPSGAAVYFIRCFRRNLKHAQRLTTEMAKKILN